MEGRLPVPARLSGLRQVPGYLRLTLPRAPGLLGEPAMTGKRNAHRLDLRRLRAQPG